MLNHGLLPYWWKIFVHSKALEYRTDIFRNIEDSYMLKNLSFNSNDIYLDIGTGCSVVPSLIGKLFNCKVITTDLDEKYRIVQEQYKELSSLNSQNFLFDLQNATELTYPDRLFTKVSLISTIEHIPDDGDVLAIEEITRVLRQHGRIVVTVPCSRQYIEQQKTFYYDGFERRYDTNSIRARLMHPTLRLVDQLYMCSPDEDFTRSLKENFFEVTGGENFSDVWYKKGWHEKYSDISILLSLSLIRLVKDPDDSIFGACLTFEKL
jgi:ubiquinone/menaquinone biosynthesis C-methylase UbiE